MPRRRTGRRRGRPRLHHARSRATTRAERRGEIDSGTAELRARRLALTGAVDLPGDPLGVLYGRGLIDKDQYLVGRDLGDLIELAARRLAIGNGSAAASWRAILGLRGSYGPEVVNLAAERARRVLDRIKRNLHPEVLALTVAVAEGRWLRFMGLVLRGRVPIRTLARLRLGLDQVARSWSKSPGTTKTLDEEGGRNIKTHA